MSDDLTIRDMRAGAATLTPSARPPEEPEQVPTPERGAGDFTELTCGVCQRTFNSPTALAVHARSHDAKQPCPDCGELFQPGPGMSAHRRAAHADKPKRPKKLCPECGKAISAKDLARHIRTVHGEEPKPVGRPSKLPRRTEWEVDDIFNTVVGLMWPGGNVPVDAFLPLIHWREATAKMLVEVSHE
jgi:uncharacterized C2H2 Zn-finger protein